MALSKEAKDRLEKRMVELGILEVDLIEKFILGSRKRRPKDQQNLVLRLSQTYSFCGIEIKCQRIVSRDLNRYHARQELCERIEEERFQEKSKKRQEIEKIRASKKRRSRKAQEKVLKNKKQRSNLKLLER